MFLYLFCQVINGLSNCYSCYICYHLYLCTLLFSAKIVFFVYRHVYLPGGLSVRQYFCLLALSRSVTFVFLFFFCPHTWQTTTGTAKWNVFYFNRSLAHENRIPVQVLSLVAIPHLHDSPCLHFMCRYCPSPTPNNKLTEAVFFDQFPKLLDMCYILRGHICLVGDFGVHVDWSKGHRAVTFRYLIHM